MDVIMVCAEKGDHFRKGMGMRLNTAFFPWLGRRSFSWPEPESFCIKGFELPIYFLDTNLPENHEEDKAITDYLYGGDSRYRIKQEAVLGIAGVRMLEALGYHDIEKYHLNEGHSAFLILELFLPYKK